MSIDLSSSMQQPEWIPSRLSDARVAIWGIGLMGGSLALALKGKVTTLSGIDPDESVCKQAQELRLFDQISTDTDKILSTANLVILCAPLGILPELLQKMPTLHPGNAVVMDIGSTKKELLPVMEQLPERFAPLGGHPMCGKEVQTLSNACADLYQGGGFALLPLKRTPQAASRLALQMVEAIGAHPVWLDPQLHDQLTASISHLPYLVANCLSAVTPLEAAPLVGPGYKSTTRLAAESIDMMIHILTNNRENVVPVLKEYQTRLLALEEALEAGNFDLLRKLFEEGAAQRAAVMEVFHQGGGA
jgi:prephenate dehydrogenase